MPELKCFATFKTFLWQKCHREPNLSNPCECIHSDIGNMTGAHAKVLPQLELPGLITRVELCLFSDLVKTDVKAHEAYMKGKTAL